MGDGDLTSIDCASETLVAEQSKNISAEVRTSRHKGLQEVRVDIIKNNTGCGQDNASPTFRERRISDFGARTNTVQNVELLSFAGPVVVNPIISRRTTLSYDL